MQEKLHHTTQGSIHYWTDACAPGPMTLVLLPGLTADHRLFDRQIEAFRGRWRLLAWDPPGHGASRPFALTFGLADKARWLHAILEQEGVSRFCLVGQSMGGYVAQSFLQQFPGQAAGFISIDSAPLGRRYTTAAELWMLRRCEPVYRLYPWQALRQAGASGCARSIYGQALMRHMMDGYTHSEYAALAGHGFRMLADAIASAPSYPIDCPALLLCGSRDQAASTRRYNRAWAKTTGLPLVWVPHAGHNSNTDNPAFVNQQIDAFVRRL